MIAHYRLPLQLFRDLLDAFTQDVAKDRYRDFAELMDYCRRSADPVGRLLLHLFGQATAENLSPVGRHLLGAAADQPLAGCRHRRHQGRSRPNLPAAGRHGALRRRATTAIRRRVASADFRALLRFQVDRARALMLSGAPLGWDLPGRIGLEIRAIVAGGLRILDKIEAVDYDVFNRRPELEAFDWPLILWRSLVRPLDTNR